MEIQKSFYNKLYQEIVASTGNCVLRNKYMFPKCLHFTPDEHKQKQKIRM